MVSGDDSTFWRRFETVRRIVIFLLGSLCFLKGVIAPQNTIPELIIGMIMVGILPLDNFLNFLWGPRRTPRPKTGREMGTAATPGGAE